MPKNTVPAAGEAMPIDITTEVSDLATLVCTIHDLANELTCVNGAGNYNQPLSDVIALLRTARDKAAQTAATVERLAGGAEIAETLYDITPSKDAEPQPLSLRLLDIFDAANGINNLIVILDLAASGLNGCRERNALAEGCGVLLSRMGDLLGDIETAREQAQ